VDLQLRKKGEFIDFVYGVLSVDHVEEVKEEFSIVWVDWLKFVQVEGSIDVGLMRLEVSQEDEVELSDYFGIYLEKVHDIHGEVLLGQKDGVVDELLIGSNLHDLGKEEANILIDNYFFEADFILHLAAEK
jgi:hypothetical protein